MEREDISGIVKHIICCIDVTISPEIIKETDKIISEFDDIERLSFICELETAFSMESNHVDFSDCKTVKDVVDKIYNYQHFK